MFSSNILLPDNGGSPEDFDWVGAWWMGYYVIFFLALLSSLPLWFYPKHLSNHVTKKEPDPVFTITNNGVDSTNNEDNQTKSDHQYDNSTYKQDSQSDDEDRSTSHRDNRSGEQSLNRAVEHQTVHSTADEAKRLFIGNLGDLY